MSVIIKNYNQFRVVLTFSSQLNLDQILHSALLKQILILNQHLLHLNDRLLSLRFLHNYYVDINNKKRSRKKLNFYFWRIAQFQEQYHGIHMKSKLSHKTRLP
ncbi:unnamed protein product [Paramecium sonneborni]|uniref:Uncharacterized protein n=1 Tax=Paramecium sonneborni TaxID=65129 RepID=A0A8S1RQD6_9CILI|nr:unnamed protein product [Paramecium sonneborni]